MNRFFESLESALKKPPRDGKTWATVKSGALILAETSGLVAKRGDNADEEKWQSSNLMVYTEGKKLYQAARRKDYESAKKAFESMTVGCHKCHEAFR